MFGATRLYWPQVAKKKTRTPTPEFQPIEDDREIQSKKLARERQMAEWRSLPDDLRTSILRSVEQKADSDYLRRCLKEKKLDDPLVVIACLAEMQLRKNAAKGDAAPDV